MLGSVQNSYFYKISFLGVPSQTGFTDHHTYKLYRWGWNQTFYEDDPICVRGLLRTIIIFWCNKNAPGNPSHYKIQVDRSRTQNPGSERPQKRNIKHLIQSATKAPPTVWWKCTQFSNRWLWLKQFIQHNRHVDFTESDFSSVTVLVLYMIIHNSMVLL